jgi:hypothetical protein
MVIHSHVLIFKSNKRLREIVLLSVICHLSPCPGKENYELLCILQGYRMQVRANLYTLHAYLFLFLSHLEFCFPVLGIILSASC